MKILLVEDSKILRLQNESALNRAGYEVSYAEDGESALSKAHTLKPDAILLDMILPKMSGPEVLKRLKADPETADIPVIVLSSLSRMNRDKLLAEGAEEYFEKSWLMPARGINRLPEVLEGVISRMRRRSRTTSAEVLGGKSR